MTHVSLHEAKTHLSSMVTEVERKGARFVICRHGKAVAELTPIPAVSRTKTHRRLKRVRIVEDPTTPTEKEWENV